MNNNDFFSFKNESGIIYFTMNAPGNNLMTNDFLLAFEAEMEKIEELSQKEDIKGLIISGGARHFSVGADVNSLVERTSGDAVEISSDKNIPASHIKQKHVFTMLHDLPFPVISAVRGFCIGSGCEIAINSHIRICEPNARIGQPESTFGILPALGGIARTTEMCGLSIAAEIILSGELFTADKAYNIGWADMLVEKKQSVQTASELISFINSFCLPYSLHNVPLYLEQFFERRGQLTV